MAASYEKTKDPLELKFAQCAAKTWNDLDLVPRTGWVQRGVKNPESVQGHTVALRNLVVGIREKLTEFSDKDINEILDMLELHDYPEAVIGDEVILEKDKEKKRALKAEKFERERVAMKDICSAMGSAGEEAFKIWMRYEERKDSASQFARQVDLYQCMEKAYEYQSAGETVSAIDFIDYADKDITHPVLRERIESLRAKLSI